MSNRNPAYLASLASIFALFAFNVHAEGEGMKKKGDVAAFEEIDVNADGVITATEAQQKDSWVASNFNTIDSDQDGYITRKEFDQVVS